MTNLPDAMRRALEECDAGTARQIWARIAPHLPQPADDHDALVCLHRARTEAKSIALNLRAYSHRWLLDRGWPSGLPDHLKPKAERIYPRIVSGVGIAVSARIPELKPAALEIRGAMEIAVYEAEADGKLENSEYVKTRMSAARDKVRKQLFGRITPHGEEAKRR